MGELSQFIQLDVAAAIGLVSGATFFIYQKIIRPHTQLINEALKTLPKIDKIHKEFYPNGGGSMTDRMIRIENGLITVAQKQFVYMLEHSLGIFQSDANGNCIEVNRTYCRMVDRTESECLGTGWLHCVHHDDRDDVEDEWLRAVRGGRDFRLGYRIAQSDGKIVDVFTVAHPMYNNDKVLIGFMGTIKLKEE